MLECFNHVFIVLKYMWNTPLYNSFQILSDIRLASIQIDFQLVRSHHLLPQKLLQQIIVSIYWWIVRRLPHSLSNAFPPSFFCHNVRVIYLLLVIVSFIVFLLICRGQYRPIMKGILNLSSHEIIIFDSFFFSYC